MGSDWDGVHLIVSLDSSLVPFRFLSSQGRAGHRVPSGRPRPTCLTSPGWVVFDDSTRAPILTKGSSRGSRFPTPWPATRDVQRVSSGSTREKPNSVSDSKAL